MKKDKRIRVLVVDDSLFMREFIASELSKDSGLVVVGKAADPFEASEKIMELNPDVMTLDIQMPRMNGIEFLRKLMPQYPLPVVVSAVSSNVFDALNAGAVDFVTKTALKTEGEKRQFISELVVKIKIASIAKVGQHKNASAKSQAAQKAYGSRRKNCLIAIGASTGGTEATSQILKELGNDLPGIVIVQHMPPTFTRLYAERLNETCAMAVKEAADGDEILPGRALIAPGGLHMTVARGKGGIIVECRPGDKVNGHCPSVDVLFESVARLKNVNALGIILTGMGSDGAKGLLAMHNAGAETIGQDQKTSVVYGMPAVAAKIGAVQVQLPLGDIARRIYDWVDRVYR
ncbi:MAG: protein-glutamate methylesterase/protein-glutamine glutaminase [Christensenellales bacterium]|jgi:two-component system chemotaxis response regulator CheB